jgi:hypothetical protein
MRSSTLPTSAEPMQQQQQQQQQHQQPSMIDIAMDSEEWVMVEERFRASINGHNDDYTAARIKQNQRPITFRLVGAQSVFNPTLLTQFESFRHQLSSTPALSLEDTRERIGFHGTRPGVIGAICALGLLPVEHKLNPSKAVDPGYFGDPKRGVNVGRYVDYCLK